MKCPKCKKEKEEVGHYARDYTNLCSDCFAKGFVASIFGEPPIDRKVKREIEEEKRTL